MSRLEKLAQNGYGSLVILNHFSKGDVPRSIAIAFGDPILGKRAIVLPQAIHQHRPLDGLFGKVSDVTFCPIVTGDTIKLVNDDPSKKKKLIKKFGEEVLVRDGATGFLRAYIDKALDALGSGGVIVIFPQAGRRSSLETISNGVEVLLNRSKRSDTHIGKVAILFLGLGIKGERDYKKNGIAGLHLRKTYEVKVGEAMTREELFEEAKRTNQNIDGVVLEKMRNVVPPTYLPQTALRE